MSSTNTPDTFLVDDRDPRVRYSSGWEEHGIGAEFNSTTKFTASAGAFWSFTFTGASVAVFGTVDNLGTGPPNSTYVIDGTNPVRYTGIPTTGVSYQQLFYQSPTLPNIEHTLLVTVVDEGSRYFLDFLTVRIPPTPSSSSVTTSESVSATQALPTASQPADRSSGSRTNIGAIVGGVVGGLGFIFLMLGLFWWFYRRRNTSSTSPGDMQYAGSSNPIAQPPTSNYPADSGSTFPVYTPLMTEELQNTYPHPFMSTRPSIDATSLSASQHNLGAPSSYASTIHTQPLSNSGLAPSPVTAVYSSKSAAPMTHQPTQSVGTSRSDMGDINDQPPPAYGG